MFFAHLFGLLNILQAGLEPVEVVVMAVAAAPHLFSLCNVAQRNFLLARGSGCKSFHSPWCLISPKYGSRVSARFLELWSSRCLVLNPSRHLSVVLICIPLWPEMVSIFSCVFCHVDFFF
jgi:hypothetical protein